MKNHKNLSYVVKTVQPHKYETRKTTTYKKQYNTSCQKQKTKTQHYQTTKQGQSKHPANPKRTKTYPQRRTHDQRYLQNKH